MFQPEIPGPIPLSFEALFALLLSCIGAAALVLPATARRLVSKEGPALKSVLNPSCHDSVERLADGLPPNEKLRYRLATVIGLCLGLGVDAAVVGLSGDPVSRIFSPMGLWFLITGPLLLGLAGRGIADMARQTEMIKHWVASGLIVDFRKSEKYEVFGRMGLHEALSWSVITAILVMFFAAGALAGNSGMMLSGLIIVIIAAGVTVRSFIGAIEPVRDALATAKAAELARIREQITPEADRLSDRISYEGWLERQPTWPVSVPITRRLIIYIVLPLAAWSGAAVTEIIANRLAS